MLRGKGRRPAGLGDAAACRCPYFASESTYSAIGIGMSKAPHAAAHAAILSNAMQQHAAGRLDQARAQYLRLLNAAPRHADALHMMGVLEAQIGQHDRAVELIGRAIAVHPGEAMFHNNLGNVLTRAGRFDEAQVQYRRALELDPARADALNNLGVLLSRLGQPQEAETLLLRARELAPDFTDAHHNLAHHYLRWGHLREALQVCVSALIVKPRDPTLRRVLGTVYTSQGMNDEATALYRAWLEEEPDNAEARFRLVACTGQGVPERAPDGYVAEIFDRFAASFDAQLATLSYRAPELVVQAVAATLPPPAAQFDVVDAGCGTGLCGPLLKPWARRLSGVDLSPGMLGKAQARAVYDDLQADELVAFLAARPACCDLLVSADTLCYFGALDGFAAAAIASLRPAGLLVFTVEAHADEPAAPDFRLQGHGRYSHRHGYVEAVLRGAGLVAVELQAVVLRMEASQPVQGWLVSARAGQAA
ncbi:MAG: methyltransferase type 12 [Leptothrix sp. (in: Bacteria)]|nr:methyltransferase type 12 [Leptothrix sp. (in: b-proteobacteria)]